MQVFAVAAFDESGNPIGDGIGGACAPVQSLNPLPLPLCWAHLSRTALGMGWPSLAGQVRFLENENSEHAPAMSDAVVRAIMGIHNRLQ